VKLDVQVKGKTVAQLYRERDEYLLRYNASATPSDFDRGCGHATCIRSSGKTCPKATCCR
jgi:hypothetical protein